MHVRRVACWAFAGVMSLDVTGPLQVFASANRECLRQGLGPAYLLQVVAEQAGPVQTSAGFALVADTARTDLVLENLDTLLIAGGEVEPLLHDKALLAWLREAEPQVRRLGSICSGALLLAEAGLLRGRAATTHWKDLSALRRYPEICVAEQCLHTYQADDPRSAHLFTSAGVSSGIDLALALVEADLGRPLALAVARHLVLYLRRPGGQAQFSALLLPDPRGVPRLTALLEWMAQHLDQDLGVERLAERASLSTRSLSRLFQRELGMSPRRYVEQLRLEAVCSLLQNPQVSLATLARLTGFGHAETLRRSFQRQFGISPSEYHQRFV